MDELDKKISELVRSTVKEFMVANGMDTMKYLLTKYGKIGDLKVKLVLLYLLSSSFW